MFCVHACFLCLYNECAVVPFMCCWCVEMRGDVGFYFQAVTA